MTATSDVRRQVIQAFAVAGLQVRSLLQKRMILAIVVIWIAQVAILLRAGGRAAPVAFQLTFAVTDLLVIAMTCGLIADDAERGTFPFLLSHGIGRRTFLSARLLTTVLIALTFALFAHIATLFLLRSDEAMTAVAAGRVARASVVSLIRILALTAVTAWMAVRLTKRQSAALGALLYCYGLAFLIHGLRSPGEPGSWLTESFLLWRDSFGRLPAEIYVGPLSAGRLATSGFQPLVYGALFGVLAMRGFDRRDLGRG